MGKLIVIEGLDGSGKSTQIELIKNTLSKKGLKYKQIKLPDYDDPSSTLVKMYLAGDFGDKPDDVNAFAASSFYAVDRYANFKRHWKAEYEEGYVILADRYTTSNCVHQCSKLPASEWDKYIEWLYNYEFDKLGIPKPDLVIFLDMDPVISQKLMSGRYEGDENKKDIHEKDTEYLEKCRKAAFYSAEKLDWKIVKCYEGEKPLSIDIIAEKIRKYTDEVL